MKVRGKKTISCSFLDPPEKPSPCFFNYTPKKGKSLFETVDKNKPVQLQLYQFRKKCTKGKNCTTTYIQVPPTFPDKMLLQLMPLCQEDFHLANHSTCPVEYVNILLANKE